jgi:hypothetical protein
MCAAVAKSNSSFGSALLAEGDDALLLVGVYKSIIRVVNIGIRVVNIGNSVVNIGNSLVNISSNRRDKVIVAMRLLLKKTMCRQNACISISRIPSKVCVGVTQPIIVGLRERHYDMLRERLCERLYERLCEMLREMLCERLCEMLCEMLSEMLSSESNYLASVKSPSEC